MSSQSNPAVVIARNLSRLVSNYCATAGSLLVVYEYFITLGREAELFWNGKWTGAAILFYFNRYLSLLVNLYGLASNAPISDQSCLAEAETNKIIDILQYLPWAVFSTLRALALTRSYLVATLIFCLSIVPIPINFSNFANGVTGANVPTAGCVISFGTPADLSRKLTITSRTCLITADLLLVCITWANLYKRGCLRHSLEMNRFVAVLLRDGTIYFIVLLFLNTLHLTLSMLSVEYSVENVSYVTQFSEPITTILISRFLLHLQSANRKSYSQSVSLASTETAHSNGGGEGGGGLGGLVFERVIGSIGSSIIPGEEEDDYDYHKDPFYADDGLKIEVDGLTGKKRGVGIGKDALSLHSGVGAGEGWEMTPVSSPLSAAGTSASASASERLSVEEVYRAHGDRELAAEDGLMAPC